MSLSQAIAISIRSFVLSFLSFLPLIGALVAAHVLLCHGRVRKQFRGDWNPASAYLHTGVAIAGLGMVINVLAVLIYVWQVNLC